MTMKSLREEICRNQTDGYTFQNFPGDLQELMDEMVEMIDHYRPLDSDGKHGDNHTLFCGCEDKPKIRTDS